MSGSIRTSRIFGSTAVLALVSLVSGLMLAPAASAEAPSATVNVANHDVAGLRKALINADNNGEADVISLAPGGTYTLTSGDHSVPGESPTGLVPIRGLDHQPITIEGNGATIRRSTTPKTPPFRILDVEGDGSLTLQDVRIRNGVSDGDGAGIRSVGDLTVIASTISGNQAAGDGGGIYDGGHLLHVTDSTLTDNFALASNQNDNVPDGGGGIYVSGVGDKVIVDSTLSANSAPNGNGGNLDALDTSVLIDHCTITSGHAAVGSGASSYGSEQTAVPYVVDSIIAGNDDASGNVNVLDDDSGPTLPVAFISQGYNILGASPTAAITGFGRTGDQLGGADPHNTGNAGVDPMLALLGDFGGPTRTQPPQYGSPAIDAGSTTSSMTDQRGLARPVDLSGIPNVADGADVGAVELQSVPAESLVVTTAVDEDNGTSDPAVGHGTSLREAINYAQVAPGPDTITFALPSGSVIALRTALPELTTPMTIDNADGSNKITIRPRTSAAFAVFDSDTELTLSGLTVSDAGVGAAVSGGDLLTVQDCAFLTNHDGAISSFGTIVVGGSRFVSNTATGGNSLSGAITAHGDGIGDLSLSVADSTFDRNSGTTGGAISALQSGAATVTTSTFTANTAPVGGAIYSSSSGGDDLPGLSVSASTFTANTATYGGAIDVDQLYTTTQIDASTFTGNAAGDGGGGAILSGGEQLSVTNSTLSGNTTTGDGGAINLLWYFATLASDTITHNSAAPGEGSGLFGRAQFTETDVDNSIVSANAGSDDVDVSSGNSDSPPWVSDGYNLIGGGNAAPAFTAIGDRTGVTNARLGPLTHNGGPTRTRALLAGSPAIDAGDDANCPATDQRGVTRPQGTHCDIGAFEVEADLAPLSHEFTEQSHAR